MCRSHLLSVYTKVRFMSNHHLLQFTGKHAWLTIRGGRYRSFLVPFYKPEVPYLFSPVVSMSMPFWKSSHKTSYTCRHPSYPLETLLTAPQSKSRLQTAAPSTLIVSSWRVIRIRHSRYSRQAVGRPRRRNGSWVGLRGAGAKRSCTTTST